MRYATRNDAFRPATTWVLDGACLRLEDDKGPPREIRLAEVAQVRLEFAPTRPEPNRYRCRLTLRNGQTLECFNRTYAGIYDFRDTSAEYGAFVRALHGALAGQAPGCRFVAGSTTANYLLGVLSTLFIAVMVVSVALFLISNRLVWLILVKLVLLAVFMPTVFRWLGSNKPRPYDPNAIPPAVLPAAPLPG